MRFSFPCTCFTPLHIATHVLMCFTLLHIAASHCHECASHCFTLPFQIVMHVLHIAMYVYLQAPPTQMDTSGKQVWFCLYAPHLVIYAHPQVLLQHGRLLHEHQSHQLTQLLLTGYPVVHLRLQQHRTACLACEGCMSVSCEGDNMLYMGVSCEGGNILHVSVSCEGGNMLYARGACVCLVKGARVYHLGPPLVA